jgi:PncC family amidohydrolase
MSDDVSRIGEALQQRGETLAIAESLTGGLLAASFARASGAGDWFRGGMVAYASLVKHSLLGVPAGPVVSAQAAAAMAAGAGRVLQAAVGLAVTGVGGSRAAGRPAARDRVGCYLAGAARRAGLAAPGWAAGEHLRAGLRACRADPGVPPLLTLTPHPGARFIGSRYRAPADDSCHLGAGFEDCSRARGHPPSRSTESSQDHRADVLIPVVRLHPFHRNAPESEPATQPAAVACRTDRTHDMFPGTWSPACRAAFGRDAEGIGDVSRAGVLAVGGQACHSVEDGIGRSC